MEYAGQIGPRDELEVSSGGMRTELVLGEQELTLLGARPRLQDDFSRKAYCGRPILAGKKNFLHRCHYGVVSWGNGGIYEGSSQGTCLGIDSLNKE